MVNQDKIADNPLAAQGIKMLAESGVLKAMVDDAIANLTSGAVDEEEDKLVERIREFRRGAGILLGLQEIGESLIKESNNEPR